MELLYLAKKQSLRVRLLHVYHSPNKVVMYINKQINKQKSTSKKTITCNRPIHIYSHSHLLYNSAENEWIWMNSGALWVHCWGLALADFGFDPRSSDSLRGSQNFVLLFCPPISCRTNFYDIWTQQRRSASPYKRSEHNFGNFTIRGRFFQKKRKTKNAHKISRSFDFRRHNSEMITNRPKLATKIALYKMSSFHFYC